MSNTDWNAHTKTKAWQELSYIINSKKIVDKYVFHTHDNTTDNDILAFLKHTSEDLQPYAIECLIGKTQFRGKRLETIIKRLLKSKKKSKSHSTSDYIQPERLLAKMIRTYIPSLCCIIKTEEFCLNIDGVYIRGSKPKAMIRERLTRITEDFTYFDKKGEEVPYTVTQPRLHQIFEFIRSQTFVELKEFDSFDNKFSILNGILDFDKNTRTWTFMKHKDLKIALKTFSQFPLIYDPNATCPEIHQMLIDIFDEDRVDLIYEELAYFLMPTIKYGKAFLHYGRTHTCKTTFSNLIDQLIGREVHGRKQIREIPLYKLTKRFQPPNLIGAVLNKCDDQGDNPITDLSWFRKLCTNKSLEEEVKNIQDHVSWNNRAKLMALSNKLIANKNFIDADYKRMIIIEHFNEFLGDKKDADIRDKIYSQEELSGLLNKCLEAWIRVEERKGFAPEWDDIEYVKEIFQMDRNAVKPFVNDYCEIGEDYENDKQGFIDSVNGYMEKRSLYQVNSWIVSKSLTEILGANKSSEIVKTVSEKTYPNTSGHKYVGIRIREEFISVFNTKYNLNRYDAETNETLESYSPEIKRIEIEEDSEEVEEMDSIEDIKENPYELIKKSQYYEEIDYSDPNRL